MLEVSQIIYTFFTSVTAFTDVCGTRIYPLVTKEGTAYPFAIYSLNEEEGQTKEAKRYAITASIYFKPDQFTECATFADVVKGLVENEWQWQNSNIDFVQEDQSFVATINFTIIK